MTSRSLRHSFVVAALALLPCFAPAALEAKGCGETLPPGSTSICTTATQSGCSCVGTPAECPNWEPPASLWGELQPVRIVENSTSYNGNQRADTRYLQWTSVDIEGSVLLSSFWGGLRFYDNSNPAAPVSRSTIDGWSGGFPVWIPGASEIDQYVYWVDAPEGDATFAAVGGVSPIGFGYVDLSSLTTPVFRYQDHGAKDVQQVYAAKIGGRAYAFAADQATGLYAYDMTKAKELNYNRCSENRSTGENNCPGVYLGNVARLAGATSSEPSQYVHGAAVGAKHFVARSSGLFQSRSVEIYDVSTPATPVRKIRGDLSTFAAGVALWSQGGSVYLAVRRLTAIEIHDVSCLENDTCSGALPAPFTTYPLASVPESDNWKSITFSRSGTTPFLFVGYNDLCHSGEAIAPNYEAVLDVSNPAAPRDVSPSQVLSFTNPTGPGAPPPTAAKNANYWSWHYADTLWGTAFQSSRMAKFSGQYLYRAGLTMGDIHQWNGASNNPPQAAFTWTPTEIYPGTSVTFADSSIGIVSSRTWDFPGGSPAGSSSASQAVTFASAGVKAVSLDVGNTFGNDSITQNVTVIDPLPNITATTANPNPALVCQPVTLNATATGQPTLGYAWTVKNSGDATVATGNGASFIWTTSGQPAGAYTGNVIVSNGAGSDTDAVAITLNALPSLPADNTFTPANDVFTAGTVQFHLTAAGATEWRWDFDDDGSVDTTSWSAWSNDPTTGPNPNHTYPSIGTRHVRAQVRNCVDLGPYTSNALTVVITQVEPLAVTTWEANGCNFGICAFSRNTAVSFTSVFLGSPTSIQYDWNGDGSFDQTSSSPVASHTYTANGSFRPVVRLIRNSETPVDFQHAANIVITDPTPASISISGASSGSTGASLSYSASASGCSAVEGGWTWSPGSGGTVTGSGSSVSISWTTSGSKTVVATNTGCVGLQGTKSVTISTANTKTITISGPTSGAPNTALSYSASASGCTPVATWTWSVGSGGTINGSATGSSISVTYASTGNRTITATNAGCTSTTGSLPINISSGGTGATCGAAGDGNLKACFSYSPASPSTGQSVSFDGSSSTGSPIGYSWTFGDGASGSGQAAAHTYSAGGAFNVTLTVVKCASVGCDASNTRSVTVSGGALPVPSFTTSATCLDVGLPLCQATAGTPINFIDTSTGNVTSRLWDFGDGVSATAASVLHTYASAGTYPMKLTATNSFGPASMTRTFAIDGTVTAPVASFSTTPACAGASCTGTAGQAVAFTDTSVGYVAQRVWSFGDGATSANAQVSHTWATGGTFAVTLTVSNTAGSSSATKTYAIGGPPQARFGTSAVCFGTCYSWRDEPDTFTDQSIGTVLSRTWSFGDGGTSTAQEASHAWTAAGNFTVTLTVGNGFGTNSVSKSFIVQARAPVLQLETSAACSGSACNAVTNQAYDFADKSKGRVDTRTWNFGDGSTSSAQQVSHTWTRQDNFVLTLTVANDMGSVGTTRTFAVRNDGPVPVQAAFTVDATCSGSACEAAVDQLITFTDSSTGSVATRTWAFGDGATATTQVATHAYQAGDFTSQLTVGNSLGSSSASRTFSVRLATPTASYSTDALCDGSGRTLLCHATQFLAVGFSDNSSGGVTSRTWDFDDGTTATVARPSHAWADVGNYDVSLTVTNSSGSDSVSKAFEVAAGQGPETLSVLLPWLATTDGALDQRSDLSIFNPRTTAVDVTLEFRRRGQPETNPPTESRSVQPGETLHVGDALHDVFGLDNLSGFLSLSVDRAGGAPPVVGSFNQTFNRAGASFGQFVPSVLVDVWPTGGGVKQSLVGLNDDADRLAYFGLTNPGEDSAQYNLRAFDTAGALLGELTGLGVVRRGQKQFQADELRTRLGTGGKTDFRIEIEQTAGPLLLPYGANLRLGSQDPSFLQSADPGNATSYVLGILRTPGPNGSQWTSDLLLANPGAEPLNVELSYTNVGAAGSFLLPDPITLAPGQSRRLRDVLSLWPGLGSSVGVIRARSLGTGRALVQAETYDVLKPVRDSYGQSMPAVVEADAAGAGKKVILTGLAQETGQTRTTIWVFNPGTARADAKLRYRRLNGQVIGEITSFAVGAGQTRQLSPSQHPLPGSSEPGGFTVEVEVTGGKLIAAAQIVSQVTNDPSYVLGQPR
jgi:PKD repeat protein